MHSMVIKLFHLTGMLEVMWNKRLSKHGVTINQYELLRWIWEWVVTNSALQRMTGQSKENISHKLKKLEDKWFLSRNSSPVDKRVWHFHLTQEWVDALSKCFDTLQASLESCVWKEISQEEIHTMSKSLDALITNVTRLFNPALS